MSNDGEYRIEHDTMGEVRVPIKALWRAQTQRAVENFPISFRGLDRNQIRAMALLKAAWRCLWEPAPTLNLCLLVAGSGRVMMLITPPMASEP